MNFRGLDLNLLVALDALLDESSVTAAGRKVHLSQSAMSCALGRLRRHFRDPLLIAVGRRMERTPYAEQLSAAVRTILQQIDSSLRGPAPFDPVRATRRFTVAASDYSLHVLLLEVQRRCASRAPGVVLDIQPVTHNTINALNRGELDLLILPDRYRLASRPYEVLFEDRLVCVVAQDNALKGRSISLRSFKAADHVVFQPESGHVIAFDAWLYEHYRFKPTVKLYLYNYTLLPQAIVGTQRITTIPWRLAQQYAATLPIRILEADFAMPPMIETLHWHAAHADDAGLKWLRGIIHAVAASLHNRAAAGRRRVTARVRK